VSQKNPSLVEVQNALGDLADSLKAAKAKIKDPDKLTAINHELIEVNHRITMVGALIFHQQTAALTAAVKKVAAARQDVEDEIQKLDKLKVFVETVARFLGLVDEVIALAKVAIPA